MMKRLAKKIEKTLTAHGKRCQVEQGASKIIHITIEPPLPVVRHLRACGIMNPVEDYIIVAPPELAEKVTGRREITVVHGSDAKTVKLTDAHAIPDIIAQNIISPPLHVIN